MVRALLIVFIIAFLLYFSGNGDIVDRSVQFTKEQAEHTEQHGIKKTVEKLWCGVTGCEKE